MADTQQAVDLQAMDDEQARLQVLRLYAELEAMDLQTERYQTMLEIGQVRSMLSVVTEVANDDAALAAVRSTMEPTMVPNDSAESPESVFARSEPSSPDVTPPGPHTVEPGARRPPRQSAFSAEAEARLALQPNPVEDPRTPPPRQTDLAHSQTSTLRMLTGGGQPPAMPPAPPPPQAGFCSGMDELNELAATLLAGAAKDLEASPTVDPCASSGLSTAATATTVASTSAPAEAATTHAVGSGGEPPTQAEVTVAAASLAKVEAELRALTLQREMLIQETELRMLTAQLEALATPKP